ncbi:transposase [Streptomyces sp. NPDC053253]|uniref:transposase n=1 Tax=Streptomyces sp. NPDC053253 TaxID=3365699 RepID=UPI0037CEDA22
MLVWDSARIHLVPPPRVFFEANAHWLTVFQLPTYAPDLNPQEGVWPLVKRNLATADLGQLTRAVKHKLKQIQYRPHVVYGFLTGTGTGTGLTMDNVGREGDGNCPGRVNVTAQSDRFGQRPGITPPPY